jgi:hypothetical protein
MDTGLSPIQVRQKASKSPEEQGKAPTVSHGCVPRPSLMGLCLIMSKGFERIVNMELSIQVNQPTGCNMKNILWLFLSRYICRNS